MVKRKKACKSASTASQEAHKANELLRNEDQNHISGVVLAARNGGKNGCYSHDNAPSLTQQFQPVVQWPHTTQSTIEQSPLISKPCLPTESPSCPILSQWQLLQNHQPNLTTHQVDHNRPPPHLARPAMPPFWLAQQPSFHSSAVNGPAAFQPFAPVGTTDISWCGPSINGQGTLTRKQPQIPNFCYHVRYPYPGFPGTWDPTSWWGQPQPTMPPCTHAFPGACCNISSLQPPILPIGSASPSQSVQRGIIHLPAKLSHKHQQLWEAQSTENVLLWATVGQLQSELADYKSRLMKLEAGSLFQKPLTTVDEPTLFGTGTSLAGQSSKRSRPRKPIPSVDALSTPDESRPQAHDHKSATCNLQCNTKELNFRKKILRKVKRKENKGHSSVQQQNEGNTVNISTNCCGGMEISGTNLLLHNQVHHQDVPGVGLCSPSIIGSNTRDSRTVFSILSNHVKEVETTRAWSKSENLVGASNIPSEDSGRDLVNISTEGYHNGGNVTEQERNVPAGWSFGNEEAACVGHQNAGEFGRHNDEDEEMDDDDSSDAEDLA